jgi:hypothetical protein
LEPTPSIHTESALWIKKGPGPEPRQSLLDAATGVEERRPLVGNLDGRGLPFLQVRFDQVGLVVHIDDGARHAGRGQAIERVIDERLAVQQPPAAWAGHWRPAPCACRGRRSTASPHSA